MQGSTSYGLVDFSDELQAVTTASQAATAVQAVAANEMMPANQNYRLNLNVQHQLQTNWCWSAVSVSVSLYYNPVSTWTQCSLVTTTFNTDCCTDGSTATCNRSWYLDYALKTVGCLNYWEGSAIPYPNVQTTMNANTPMGVRTQWSNGGGHFLTIVGYATVTAANNSIYQYLYLSDPWYGNSMVLYSVFCTNYQNIGGTWTDSYFTQP